MRDDIFIFGFHAVEALLKRQPEKIIYLALLSERSDQKIQMIIALAEQSGIQIKFMKRTALDQLTQNATHQGIVAFCQPPKRYIEQDLPVLLKNLTQPAFLLILDGIQDPHNLGACLRSADAAGVTAVIAPKDKSVGLTPTVCKVASGAVESVPFIPVTNLARTLRFLKEQAIWVFGADDDAKQTVYQADLKVPLALVLGAEGDGMRRLTREHCDLLLRIPMQGAVSSLNVSVATGVLLFEAVRQRGDI
ncbi:MAG: rlmB [Gammaproteobacteria bacterium]|jgi:23S rRNA (guanosine2251-2'-O)-methyltransferase|nr:rlmB [Gammaproteobacteria bacterium]